MPDREDRRARVRTPLASDLLPGAFGVQIYVRDVELAQTVLASHTRKGDFADGESFDAAIKSGLKRANKTLKNVVSAWIASQDIELKNGKVFSYRVRMKVTFILA